MLIRLRHDEEGIAMVVSLMVAFVVMLLATVILGQAIHGSGRSAYGRNRLTSVSTAEAGLDYWYNYLQKTSPSSYTTSAITGTVGSSPAIGTFSATPTFYTNAAGTTALSGAISSSNFPLSVKIKSTGTANSITRTMESFITLRPIYGGFQGAVITNNSISLTNQTTINGNTGNDGDFYVLNGSFSAPSGLESIKGSIFVVNGTASVSTNTHIYGQVWANGSVTVSQPLAQIDGDAKSTTSSVTVSSGTVIGNASYCIPPAPGASVHGTKTQTCALGAPPTQTFPQIKYVQSAWVTAGYTNFKTFSDPVEARAYVEATNVGGYNYSTGNGFNNIATANTVVRITGGACATAFSNSNNASISVKANLAIVSDCPITLGTHSTWTGISGTKSLFLMNPYPSSGSPDCTKENVTIGNNNDMNSLQVGVYSPCTATVSNQNAWSGQVIGNTVSINNQFTENYVPVVIPGANLTGYNQDIAYIREVA